MMKNVVALDLEVAVQALDDFPGNLMRCLLLVPWRPLLTGFTVVLRLYTHNTGSGKPQTVVSLSLAVGGFTHTNVYLEFE